ncbi:MAG: hypothetical protein B0A82_23910 [Alkalinema sp. CACIAM 70d]|nr:MAG: hypothetical protein B0A82_23910 [Alkalinema sp. CACIAM 70d]
MDQRQDNNITNTTVSGNLNYNPIQVNNNYGPKDPLDNKSDQEKAEYYNREGNAKIGISDKEAIENFNQSILCDGSLPAPYIGLGTIEYRQGNLNAALGHFRKAEFLYAKFPTLAAQRAEVNKLIQKISNQINSKQKKSWFRQFF